MRKIGNPKDAQLEEARGRRALQPVERARRRLPIASRRTPCTAWSTWRAGSTNKNRLDLAKTLLDEAKKRNEKYAPLQNAYGLYYMHKGSLEPGAAVVPGRGRG